ncbi:MAG: amino-acid N-acetyltransferase [Pseudomonadales bacterium]
MSNDTTFTEQLPDADTQHKLVRWLREAAPYVIQHRRKTFVIMLGSDAIDSPALHSIVHDIALLNSLGVRVVLVHGVRTQLDKKLAERAVASQFVRSIRITDSATLELAIEACSLVRTKLETLLSMGLANSPIHGEPVRVASGNVITARPAGVIDGCDLQHAGLVRKVDTGAINRLLDMGNLVLLSPLGYSPSGAAFSLTCSDVAGEVAAALGAEKLIVFCNPEPLADAHGAQPRELSLADTSAMLQANPQAPAWLRAAANAVHAGVHRAHLLNHAQDGALLQELFTVDGAGTLLSQARFEITRQAVESDLPAIIEIIAPLEQSGVLVARDRAQLAGELHHFTVVEREGMLVALAALYPYCEGSEANPHIAEIACITTHPDYRNASRGTDLLTALEIKARNSGISKLFVLTTQTTHWFLEHGFREVAIAELPEQRQALYNYQRNSKVLLKSIA